MAVSSSAIVPEGASIDARNQADPKNTVFSNIRVTRPEEKSAISPTVTPEAFPNAKQNGFQDRFSFAQGDHALRGGGMPGNSPEDLVGPPML